MQRHIQRPLLAAILGVLTLGVAGVRADDWPQWLGPQRDGVWREDGILEKFPKEGLKPRWRTKIGEGYSGPAVAGGKVYITDRLLAKGVNNPKSPFDAKSKVGGKERILCLSEADGTILWKHEYDCAYQISYASGPRTTPVVSGGKVYAVGAMGDLFCLDADSGKVVWSKKLIEEYTKNVPFWGFSGHPLVDGNRLICLVGGQGSVAVAFDKDTGAEIWKNLSAKEPGYAPPMIYEIGGKRQLIVWHPESVNSLDPVTGMLIWTQAYGELKSVKAGMTIPTPRQVGDQLYFTNFYNGSLLLNTHGDKQPDIAWRVKGRSELPEDTEGLHCVMSTPFIKGGHIYGVCSYGELRCIDLKTGKRVWSTQAATTKEPVRWAHAFLIENGDRYFLFNELGDLIIAKLSPEKYEEIDRVNLLAPTNTMAGPAGRRVLWSHPAFANRAIFARNDDEIICVPLAAK